MKKYTILIALFVMFFANINVSQAEETTSTSSTVEESRKEVKQLKLNWVKVIWKNLVELEFDSNIDEASEKDISVKVSWDNEEEIFVENYKTNGKIVELFLEKDLESNKNYEIIIFSIMWEDGSTITSGLDWALEFSTWDLSIYDEKEEEIKEEVEENEEIEMTSAWIEEKTQTWEIKKNKNLAWKEIKDEELKNNIEVVASKKDELAKTWPEHVLLAILALILAGLVWYTLNQRKNNKI